MAIYVVSASITIAGHVFPVLKGMKKAQILLDVAGLSFGAISTFAYNPTKGDYIVTTTSLNKKKGILKTTIKIYKSKSDWKSKGKPIVTYSGSKFIGFR